jgi:hypothetical protein
MADEKPSRSAPSQIPDLQASLADAWEAIGVLTEKVNDLDLEVSAALIAFAKILPGFAEEFERARNDFAARQRKADSELPLSVHRAIRQLRQSGKGKHS